MGGQLTIRITDTTHTLIPNTGEPVRVVAKINVLNFRILGQPDTHVRFFMSGENLIGLYYEEKRENQALVIALAAPTFSGPSS